jgi:hypothetical protein
MATRSSTSQYQPSPPVYGTGGKQNGRFSAAISVVTTSSRAGLKPNMCCAPTTNGSREHGLAPSKPASAKSMKGMKARLSR